MYTSGKERDSIGPTTAPVGLTETLLLDFPGLNKEWYIAIVMLSRLRGINWLVGQGIRLHGTAPKKLPAALKACQSNHGLFVDKTRHLAALFNENRQQILFTLPRRLGKTTYVNLTEQLCKDKSDFAETELGQTEFFKTWPQTVPCIKFDFQLGISELRAAILGSIIDQANAAEVPLNMNALSVGGSLRSLLNGLYAKKNQDIVVLIDEYDTPLNVSDKAKRNTNAEVLIDFFGALRGFEHLRLLLVVGTMNRLDLLTSVTDDLIDVSGHKSFAKMFGFTKEEVQNKVFPPQDTAFYNGLNFERNQKTTTESGNHQKEELLVLEEESQRKPDVTDRERHAVSLVTSEEVEPVKIIVPPTVSEKRELFLEQLDKFYDGYLFSAEKTYEPTYNPFSVLECKQNEGLIDCYWADKMYMKELDTYIRHFPHLMDKDAVITFNHSFSDARISGHPLSPEAETSLLHLWTSGLLTIHKFKDNVYTLVPTNGEVVTAYREQVLSAFRAKVFEPELDKFIRSASEGKFDDLFHTIDAVLMSDRNRIRVDSDITSTLSYFSSMTHGKVRCIREVTGIRNKRMDCVLKAGKHVYVIENEVQKSAKEAFGKIVDRRFCADILKEFEKCEICAVGLNYTSREGTSALVSRAQLLLSGRIGYIEVFRYGFR